MSALSVAIACDLSRFMRVADQLNAGMAKPMAAGTPLRAGLEAVAEQYAIAMQKRYNRASAGDGTWKPLAASTIASKKRKTLFPAQILYLTGQLFASLTPGAAGSIYDVLDDRVRYGTRDRKARFHQTGGPHLPARPILVAPDRAQLVACTAPIVTAWKDFIRAVCSAA